MEIITVSIKLPDGSEAAADLKATASRESMLLACRCVVNEALMRLGRSNEIPPG